MSHNYRMVFLKRAFSLHDPLKCHESEETQFVLTLFCENRLLIGQSVGVNYTLTQLNHISECWNEWIHRLRRNGQWGIN